MLETTFPQTVTVQLSNSTIITAKNLFKAFLHNNIEVHAQYQSTNAEY